MDHTSIHPSSVGFAHLVDLHLYHGAPQNLDPKNPVQILVNHGFVVGFGTTRLQPAWAAYRVALTETPSKFDRPHVYYADQRLPRGQRLGPETFGKPYNVGHMSPNEVINQQFGRLAQLETFLMSNMCPQHRDLNQGVWAKLEGVIREIRDTPEKDHVWAIVGPVFGEDPEPLITRSGHTIPVPEAFFCVTVDPFQYPYWKRENTTIDCYLIPQDAPRRAQLSDYVSTLDEVEERSMLRFFPGWNRAVGLEAGPLPKSRMQRLVEAIESAPDEE